MDVFCYTQSHCKTTKEENNMKKILAIIAATAIRHGGYAMALLWVECLYIYYCFIEIVLSYIYYLYFDVFLC